MLAIVVVEVQMKRLRKSVDTQGRIEHNRGLSRTENKCSRSFLEGKNKETKVSR